MDRRRTTWLAIPIAVWAIGAWRIAFGHDIPNARVDRSIQVVVGPGRLEVVYEVSLSELTLTQDLRTLIGTLPGGDRVSWIERYGLETGPLNAKGFLITVDGEPIALTFRSVASEPDDHPRLRFVMDAAIPTRGRLTLKDINYLSSEGMSRLAARAESGVTLRSDGVPGDVAEVPWRPTWQLSDAEERRTRELAADYEPASAESSGDVAGIDKPPDRPTVPSADSATRSGPARKLVRLIDDAGRWPTAFLLGIAIGLGAVHALQPGHGKTLVAAAALGEGGAWWSGVGLALVTTAVHFSSVLAIAAALAWSRSTRYQAIDEGLTAFAGFLIAAVGLWRLGRNLGGHPLVVHRHLRSSTDRVSRGLLGLGLAGGIVPCWEAVTLVMLAEALDKLGLGLLLVAGFSAGMACVLVIVGLLAGRLGRLVKPSEAASGRRSWLGVVSSLILVGIGLALFAA